MNEEKQTDKIVIRDVEKEIRTAFLDYSMSVITARAIPDVKDGLKPVHRRILHGMYKEGITPDKPHKKSAKTVGFVLAATHPHGDSSVYDAMVRMAQPFAFRYPLIDGHGNFGSIDGDGAAAMRYTESRLSKIAMELLRDIDKDTVEWTDTYDGEDKEPVVLPSRFPNLLVNSNTGIAVGMATNIPCYNLKETIAAAIALIKNPSISNSELIEIMPAPDFPTGAQILGSVSSKQVFETGRGSIQVRSKAEIVNAPGGKERIIITEIPYMVNKSTMIEKIADLVKNKEVEGITEIRDESNREGIKVVIELRREAQSSVILNQLYKKTPLQNSFGANILALVDGTPKQLSVREALEYYVKHQIDVVTRRTQFDLKKAQDRLHILDGYLVALANIDEVIRIIKSAENDTQAMTNLIAKFGFSEIQCKNILDLRLRRLTGMERHKVEEEIAQLLKQVEYLMSLLNDGVKLNNVIIKELTEISDKFGDDRRTVIIEDNSDIQDEALIPVQNVVITMTSNGYIKRIPLANYQAQNRGGRGVKGLALNEDDIVDMLVNMSTHDHLLLFSNFGKVYRIKGYDVPGATRTAKGIPVINLLKLDKGEKISSILPIKNLTDSTYYLFVTKEGLAKRTKASEFELINKSGKLAITLNENDELMAVKETNGDAEIIVATSTGKVVRVEENDVRVLGRTSKGSRVVTIDGGIVINASTSKEGKYLLAVSENGYGKLTKIEDYRLTGKGAKGVKTFDVSPKTGNVASVKVVNDDEDLLIMSSDGIVIRINAKTISKASRITKGPKLINLNNGAKVVKIGTIESEEE